jgi:hypothetical protein
MIKKRFKGVALFITVLSLGGLIVIIGLSSALIAYFSYQSVYSVINSTKAFYAAESGLQDALIRVERNKNYRDTFFLNIDGIQNVTVSFSQYDLSNDCIIISTSTISQANKKIQAIINIDNTGLINVSSTIENIF